MRRRVEVLEQRLGVLPAGAELVTQAGDRDRAVTLAESDHPLLRLRERVRVVVEAGLEARRSGRRERLARAIARASSAAMPWLAPRASTPRGSSASWRSVSTRRSTRGSCALRRLAARDEPRPPSDDLFGRDQVLEHGGGSGCVRARRRRRARHGSPAARRPARRAQRAGACASGRAGPARSSAGGRSPTAIARSDACSSSSSSSAASSRPSPDGERSSSRRDAHQIVAALEQLEPLDVLRSGAVLSRRRIDDRAATDRVRRGDLPEDRNGHRRPVVPAVRVAAGHTAACPARGRRFRSAPTAPRLSALPW